MSNANNYPSCIKVPATHSKQSMALAPQKNLQAIATANRELISVANRIFGTTKWSHSITSQTLDYVEAMLGKFKCGCVSFVRIQLEDSTFHEDMGYFSSEAATKSLAIETARLGSLTNGFEKALCCFGNTVEAEVKRVLKTLEDLITDNHKEESIRTSLNEQVVEELKLCAQSTPYTEKKENIVPRSRSKSPNLRKPVGQSAISRSKSPIGQKENIESTTLLQKQSKNQNQLKGSTNSENNNSENQKNEEINVKVVEEENEKRVLTEEELLRLERKRKQIEKQAEYKRLLKERELQKSNLFKKPNPKY